MGLLVIYVVGFFMASTFLHLMSELNGKNKVLLFVTPIWVILTWDWSDGEPSIIFMGIASYWMFVHWLKTTTHF